MLIIKRNYIQNKFICLSLKFNFIKNSIFNSREELIFIPRLPYHLDFRYTERDDRYMPFIEAVEQAQRVAYITTFHPELDAYLRTTFVERGISWTETQVGDYLVFHDLSRLIRPEDMNLGLAAP